MCFKIKFKTKSSVTVIIRCASEVDGAYTCNVYMYVVMIQDGCDLVFRSSKSESSREYRGVNGTDFEQEIPRHTTSGEPDDHLLSM